MTTIYALAIRPLIILQICFFVANWSFSHSSLIKINFFRTEASFPVKKRKRGKERTIRENIVKGVDQLKVLLLSTGVMNN